jgi:hypothetical protein
MTPTADASVNQLLTEAEWKERWGIELTDDPQAFAELPREAYDQLPGYNYSLLKVIWAHCPFKAWLEFRDPNRPARERKEHFLHGDLHHCHLLEPEKYGDRYAIPPEGAPNRPTEAQLAKLADTDIENLGIIPGDMPKRPTQKQVDAPAPNGLMCKKGRKNGRTGKRRIQVKNPSRQKKPLTCHPSASQLNSGHSLTPRMPARS